MKNFIGRIIIISVLLGAIYGVACPTTQRSSIVITGVVPEKAVTSVTGDTATIQTNTATVISITKNSDGSVSVEVKAQ